jgi:hypothetical protein
MADQLIVFQVLSITRTQNLAFKLEAWVGSRRVHPSGASEFNAKRLTIQHDDITLRRIRAIEVPRRQSPALAHFVGTALFQLVYCFESPAEANGASMSAFTSAEE